jgi:hypothetical protein
MLASQLRERTSVSHHPVNHLVHQPPPPRQMKSTIVNINYPTKIHKCNNHPHSELATTQGVKTLHTHLTKEYLARKPTNRLLGRQAPTINIQEKNICRRGRLLA